MDKLVSFENLKSVHGRYQITSGVWRGWEVEVSIFMKSVKATGTSEDGSPKFEIKWDIQSTSIPPVSEEVDNR